MILTATTAGSVLRTIRKAANLTQLDLGALIGLPSLGAVSNVEIGRRDTSMRTLLAWVDKCGFELRVVPKGGGPALEIAGLDDEDRRLFAALVDRWPDLEQGERNMLRLQMDYVRRVSGSARQENVKTGDGGQ